MTLRRQKQKISKPALMARINRKLAHEDQRLRQNRTNDTSTLGEFFIVDMRRNFVVSTYVNPVALARELGVLADWEEANV